MGMIESTFWSLFVEVRFYLIFSFIYFYINKSKSNWYIFALFIFSVLFTFISLTINSTIIRNIHLALDIIGLQHYGWFASGAFLYQYLKTKDDTNLLYSILTGISNIIFIYSVQFHSVELLIMITIIFTLFITTSLIKPLQIIISNRFFLFIGMISFPLYLIHENMMVSLILQFESYFPEKYLITLPLIILVIIIAIAYIFTLYVEPFAFKVITLGFEFVTSKSKTSDTTLPTKDNPS
jgi:peptidoglycan/LPS O-acetylase OafA/YrhL